MNFLVLVLILFALVNINFNSAQNLSKKRSFQNETFLNFAFHFNKEYGNITYYENKNGYRPADVWLYKDLNTIFVS